MPVWGLLKLGTALGQDVLTKGTEVNLNISNVPRKNTLAVWQHSYSSKKLNEQPVIA